MAIIETVGLSYTYSKETPFEKKALNNVNIKICKGSCVGIIGHTGSGKSTLIQHFNGLLKPESGKIYINKKDIWSDKNNVYKYRFKVGVAFQYPEHQLFEETVFKDIAFGPTNMGLSTEEIKNRVNWAINVVGLSSEYLNQSPFELSGGQKRKVALAGIISMDPDILVLDEPTAGLDPKSKNTLLKNIELYHQNKKNTIIFVSHNMDDVVKYCSDVIVMNNAKVYMHGSTNNVFVKADELLKIGLNIPTITKIFNNLRKCNYVINENINTTEEAISYIEKNCKIKT